MRPELNRNDLLFISLRKAFGFYLLCISILTLGRLGFVAYFAPPGLYEDYFSDLLQAFYMGWRYDSIVASYLVAPFVLISIFVATFRSKLLTDLLYKFSRFFYFFAALIIFVFTAADLGFYSYFQDHLNILFFGVIEDDTAALATTVWKNYPVTLMSAGIGLALVGLLVLVRKIFSPLGRRRSFFQPGPVSFVFMSLLSFVLLIGGVRGGYGVFVLAPKYADFSPSMFVNQVALNGIVTFENAYKLRRRQSSSNFSLEKSMGYRKGIHQAFTDFLGIDTSPTNESQLTKLLERRTPPSEKLDEIKPHVVVFIMESFGGSWNRFNSPEFDFLVGLKKHMGEDFYFENFISSDNGTIGSLMAIASNLPPRPGARYLSESKYMQLELPSAAHVPYKTRGYETSFVYGGKLGWRGIGKYFKRQGYHNVEGENAIKLNLGLEEKSGTEWGLYDEHMFGHILKKLKDAKRPQFILALSTSNHPPFETPASYKAPSELTIPDDLKERISREEDLFLERFKAFQYANDSLSNFIDSVKAGNLKDRTIVSFTGDHNFWGFMNYTGSERFLKYQVPFYIYAPKEIAPKNYEPNKLGSHEDIFPTLYYLSLSDTPFVAFGENLFSDVKSYAIGANIYAGDDGVVYKGKNYVWKEKPYTGEKSESDLNQESKVYRSSVSVADFFLRQAFKELKSQK